MPLRRRKRAPIAELQCGTRGILATARDVVFPTGDLHRATGQQRYAEKAQELAQIILNSQQSARPIWTTPLTRFFYTSPARDRILHYSHRSHEQAPIVALAQLCEAFPAHKDWMKWYSAVALYSEYLKQASKFTQPYGVLPASIYREDEYLQANGQRREAFRRQVLNGVPLGEGHFLRLFPVWFDYRGHFGVVLSQAKALSTAANLRGDLELADLSNRQLEWVVGRNPFVQSTMYGEGYDFAPQFTEFSGDIAGSLPVGIESRGDNDAPYWPFQNCYTYKEVWVRQ